jgi:geranylgeranyl diphosphate synthase type II
VHEGQADWQQWFESQRAGVDRALSAHFARWKTAPSPHSRLLEAVQYSITLGAKRLRPVLVLEMCRACGGDDQSAWPAALAVECIHTFSLIHDDLPAMDDDDLRRGQPTSHRVFGEALAILAGDWLVAHAFEQLSASAGPHGAASVRVLAAATTDMCAGQAADMAGERRPARPETVEYIHRNKTARLMEACCELGAIAAGADAVLREAAGCYGRHLGLAFQIVDDLLDRTSSSGALGKRAGKDDALAKQTFPAVFGEPASRQRAQREIDDATRALAPLGSSAARLRELARFVLGRER